MHIPRVVISFDDGRKDNYIVVKEILEKRNIPATFNITAGYIEKKIGLDGMCFNEPMSVEEVIDISKNSLFEIAGHGYAHDNTFEDWNKGINKLKEWLGRDYFEDGYGVASPHSVVSDLFVSENISECKNLGIKYIRTGLKNQRSFLQRCVSKCARITGNKCFMYLPIKNSIKAINNNSYLYYSVPVLNTITNNQINYLIEKVIEKGGDVIFQFHSIVKYNEELYEDLYSWDYAKFELLCEYLCEKRKNGEIVICKNIELCK